jgi:hypothetical protein
VRLRMATFLTFVRTRTILTVCSIILRRCPLLVAFESQRSADDDLDITSSLNSSRTPRLPLRTSLERSML